MIVHDVIQGTEEWKKLRAGRPTSSNFGRIISGLGKPSDQLEDYALVLATEKYLGAPIDDGWQGNKFTLRGHELEGTARADYEMIHQVRVDPVGFITDDLARWGTSTDGLVGDDGLVEIKNLIATRFAKLKIYYQRHGIIPTEYIPQVQGELFVSEREWCDFIAYHPQFDPIIHRIYRDPDYHMTLEGQLKAVIRERNRLLKLIK
jgi:hypothetical protein